MTLSVSDSSSPSKQTASTTLTLVISSGPLTITTPSPLPSATVGMPYAAQITASGGAQPYNWSATNLPMWLTFDVGGSVCGTPVTVCGTPTSSFIGSTTFTVTVIDSGSPTAQTVSQVFSLTVTMVGGTGAITVQSASVGQGLQVPITITFNPAPTIGVSISTGCTSSATPGCLTLTSSSGSVMIGQSGEAGTPQILAPIHAGTTAVSIYVKAYAAGTSTITASMPGYANGTGTVTVANSGFVLSGPNGIGGAFTTFQGVPTTLTVYAARLDSSNLFVEPEEVIGTTSLSVPIASSPASVGTVSPTLLAFTGGTNSVTATFTASGTNSGAASVMVTQPSGFTIPAVGGTINVTVQVSGLIPPSVTLGNNLQAVGTVSLSGNAPSNITVTLTSSDTTRLQFACVVNSSACSTTPPTTFPAGAGTINVEIPQNQTQSANFYMRGYAGTGSVPYTISAPGYGTVAATVPLAPSGFIIQTPGGFGSNFTTTVGAGADATLNVYTAALPASGPILEAVAADKSVSATVTSGTTSVGTITTSPVAISGGSSFGATTFHAVGAGTSSITASAAGYTSVSCRPLSRAPGCR